MHIELEELSDHERELLKAARTNGGQLALFAKADTRGPAVRTKLRAFHDPHHRDIADQYVQALHHLVELQLLRSETREQFLLTNHGWELGRKV
jgi:hypothetical protein